MPTSKTGLDDKSRAIRHRDTGSAHSATSGRGTRDRRMAGGAVASGSSQEPRRKGRRQAVEAQDTGWLTDFAIRRDAKWQGQPRFPLPLIGVVIHATKGGDVRGALNEVQRSGRSKSWHFTIARDGMVFQHVPISRTANHSGKGTYNRLTLGIELANLGPLVRDFTANGTEVFRKWIPKKNRHKFKGKKWPLARPKGDPVQLGSHEVGGKNGPAWWEQYPPEQIQSLNSLLARIQATKWAVVDGLRVGHSVLAPDRKRDPGPQFPWHQIEPFLASHQ